MLAFSLRTTSPHRGPALLTHKWLFTIINLEALVRKIFSINFRPTLNVGRTFFVFKVRSFKQKAVSRTPSIHVRGSIKLFEETPFGPRFSQKIRIPEIWQFLFFRIFESIPKNLEISVFPNFGDNSKNEKAGIHALYRARYPPFPYDRRRSEGSTARRRRTKTQPPRGGDPAPQRPHETAARRRPGASRQRERERENSNSEKAGIRAIGHLFPPFL
jgi:hypothetical protein